jgi:hypothetical protein
VPELPPRTNSEVPFAYALGVIVGVGVARIDADGIHDVVHLNDGRLVVHTCQDNSWRILDAGWPKVTDA